MIIISLFSRKIYESSNEPISRDQDEYIRPDTSLQPVADVNGLLLRLHCPENLLDEILLQVHLHYEIKKISVVLRSGEVKFKMLHHLFLRNRSNLNSRIITTIKS